MDEAGLVELIRGGELDRAATATLELYGPEIYGFLISYVGNEAESADVFLQVTEDLWRGLPGFDLRASVRTWLYVLARNAAARYRRSPANQRERRASSAQLAELVARTRSRTAPWLRTEVKDHVRTLRESLEPDERALLILRVDRKMPWEDVARVTLGSESPDAATLAREVARVTKRFQLIKDELRRLARASGLIEDDA